MTTAAEPAIFKPHRGPQEAFLACPADVAIYGGAAGGGKTVGLLLDQARWAPAVKGFQGVIFRRTYPDIMAGGGLWDESQPMMRSLGAQANKVDLRWSWPNGSAIKLSHMQHAEDRFSWQGSQLAVISFDELTHFDESVFWYMLSRLRSTCGLRPYMRASCNPESTSWVAKLIDWWVDPQTGFPIPERAGALRWFVRRADRIVWADRREDPLLAGDVAPMSFTFIPAKITDNPTLLNGDSAYLSKLQNLPAYERATLLDGNWRVKRVAGMVFRREWFRALDARPLDVVRWVRYWDRAATEVTPATPDPDATSGTLMGRRRDGRWVVADEVNVRLSSHRVVEVIRNTATQDPPGTEVWLEQDPGQAGITEISYLTRELAGLDVHANRVTTDKLTRAKPFSAQAEAGNVDFVRGRWNDAWLAELENFVDEDQVKPPSGYHDDRVDSGSGAFNVLVAPSMPRIR